MFGNGAGTGLEALFLLLGLLVRPLAISVYCGGALGVTIPRGA